MGRTDVHSARAGNVWIIGVGARWGIPLVHADGGRPAAPGKRGDNQNVAHSVYPAESSLASSGGNRDVLLEEPDADVGVAIDSETFRAEHEDVIGTTRGRTRVSGCVAVCEAVLVRCRGGRKRPLRNVIAVLGAAGCKVGLAGGAYDEPVRAQCRTA